MHPAPSADRVEVIAPSHPELAIWVEQLWVLESSEPITQRVYCTGKPQLLLHSGAPFVERRPAQEERRQPTVYLCGQMTRFCDVTAPSGARTIGVVLHPAALRAFVDAPAILVNDGQAPANDLGPCLRSIASLPLAELPARQLLPQIERCLLRGMRRDVRLNTARHLTEFCRKHHSVAALLRETAWSERKLQRFFADYVGLSPRAFSSVTRLARAVDLLHTRSAIRAAVDAGYFDQPHFIKACKSHTGYTPAEYARICWGRREAQ